MIFLPNFFFEDDPAVPSGAFRPSGESRGRLCIGVHCTEQGRRVQVIQLLIITFEKLFLFADCICVGGECRLSKYKKEICCNKQVDGLFGKDF